MTVTIGKENGVAARRKDMEEMEIAFEPMDSYEMDLRTDRVEKNDTRLALGSSVMLESDLRKEEYFGRPHYKNGEDGVVDSGATAMLITPETADKLQANGFGLIRKYAVGNRPTVKYAGGDGDFEANITGYIMGNGHLVEKLEIVEDLDVNLIGIRYFIDRGLEVSFSFKGVYVAYSGMDGSVMKQYIGYYDEISGLFMADIKALMSRSQVGEGILIQREAGNDQSRKAFRTIGAKNMRVTERDRKKIRLWHLLMEHRPLLTLARGLENGWWNGVDPDITAAKCRALSAEELCWLCMMRRAMRTISKGSGVRQQLVVGAEFAVDVLGKFAVASMGCHDAVTIRDLATGFGMAFGLALSKKGISEAIRRYKVYMASHGHKVKRGRTDAGAVEVSEAFDQAMSEMGIAVTNTPPYEPQKDIERSWRNHKDDLAGIIAGSTTLTEKDWLHALTTAVDMSNIVGNSASDAIDPTKTPYELVTGKKPDITLLMELKIGDLVVVKCPNKDRKIGTTRNKMARVMRVTIDGTKGVHLNMADDGEKIRVRGGVQTLVGNRRRLDGETSQKKVSIDADADGVLQIKITGDEGQRFPHTLEGLLQREKDVHKRELEAEERRSLIVQPRDVAIPLLQGGQMDVVADVVEGNVDKPMTTEASDAGTYIETPSAGVYFQQEEMDDDEMERGVGSSSEFAGGSIFIDKGRCPMVKFDEDLDGLYEDEFEDFNAITDEVVQRREATITAYKARIRRDDNNPTVRTVQKRPDLWDRWAPAMMREFWGMVEKESIEEVDRETALAIGISGHVTTMNMKTPEAGSEKVRVTIDGGRELRNGIFPDRQLLASPAMEENGLKLIIAFTAYFDMTLEYSDVNQAFMYNDIANAVVKRDIVIQLSEFECGKAGGGYYKYKALGYGAPDAGIVWYNQMVEFFERDMQLSKCDQFTCVWYRPFGEFGLVMVGLATDDIVKSGTKDDESQQFLAFMKLESDKRWKMTHGNCEKILGVDVTRNHDGSITLTQGKQIRSIKEHFFPGNTPVPEIWALGQKRAGSSGEESAEEDFIQVPTTEYRQGLGKLGHMRITRTDTRPALAIAAEHSTDPRKRHMTILKETAAYIITTREMGLTFHRGPERANPRKMLSSWSAADASWSMESTGQSRLGFAIWIGDPEYFKSKKKYTAAVRARSMREIAVSRSATTCELQAQAEVTDEIISIRMALSQIAGTDEEDMSGIMNNRMIERKAGPSRLLHRLTTADIKEMLPSDDPTLMLVDNRTLSNCILYEHSSSMKKLKTQIRLMNYIKMAISQDKIKQVLVRTEHQPADMLTKMLTSPTLQWLHMEEMMGSHLAVTKYKSIVRDMRRGRRPQGKLVHIEQKSDMAQSGSHDGDGGHNGSEKMVGVVERDESDVESSMIMANGSRVVRMADDILENGDTAATMIEAMQEKEAEMLDPREMQKRLKARLLEKRMEKMEEERERVAHTNMESNGVESESTVKLRRELKAGKKRQLQQDVEEERTDDGEIENSKRKKQRERDKRSKEERVGENYNSERVGRKDEKSQLKSKKGRAGATGWRRGREAEMRKTRE